MMFKDGVVINIINGINLGVLRIFSVCKEKESYLIWGYVYEFLLIFMIFLSFCFFNKKFNVLKCSFKIVFYVLIVFDILI